MLSLLCGNQGAGDGAVTQAVLPPGLAVSSHVPCPEQYPLFPQSVEGEHHEKAVELLKAAQGKVKLVVRYTPKVLEEMESRFEKMRSAKRRQQT